MYEVVKCGFLVTGDGKTLLENKAIWIQQGKIIDITEFDQIPYEGNVEIIMDTKDLVAPGAINHHTHGCSSGPMLPTGSTPFSIDKALGNINRHLSQGTTTIINVCGFPVFEEIKIIKENTKANLFLTSAHTSLNIKAAQMADGKGINSTHTEITVTDMVNCGAVAVGEIGGGKTLGGSHDTLVVALEGFDEALDIAKRLKKPLILHNDVHSVRKVEEILIKNKGEIPVIAAHCNHQSFNREELIEWTTKLKKLGAVIDIGTFYITENSQQKLGGSPDNFDVLAESGLADIMSTDYNGGLWDGLFEGMSRMVKKGYCTIPEAIAMGTGNLEYVIPDIIKERGLIKKGYFADFVVTDIADIGNIKKVFINGSPCFEGSN